MKITDVKVYPVSPDIATSPSGIRIGWVFVVVETDEGIVGYGECSNYPRKGTALVSNAVETLKDSLIGQDPSHIERILHELYRNYTYLGSRGLSGAVVVKLCPHRLQTLGDELALTIELFLGDLA